jgi:hypothetical protein
MSDNEVNKIIAEFMGFEYSHGLILLRNKEGAIWLEDDADYVSSLDALVPVWERLGNVEYELKKDNERFTCALCNYTTGFVVIESYYKTIQQAAAHATAKAILELQGGE